MEPRDYLATIRRNWIIVLVMTMLGLAGGYAASAVAKPEYTATTSIYFSINFGKSANDLNQGATYAQSQMLSYAVLARSPRVLQTVIDNLGLPLSPAALAPKVSVTSPQNTPILDISDDRQFARRRCADRQLGRRSPQRGSAERRTEE